MLSDDRLSAGELEECLAVAEAGKDLPHDLAALALRELQSRRAREAAVRQLAGKMNVPDDYDKGFRDCLSRMTEGAGRGGCPHAG